MQLTREQVESRKEKAVRFIANVLDDEDRADEVEAESLEDYADRRQITIINPTRRNTMAQRRPKTKADLEDLVEDLQDENAALQARLDAVENALAGDDDEIDDDEEED